MTRILSGEFSWTKSLGRRAVAGLGGGNWGFCVGDGLGGSGRDCKISKYCGCVSDGMLYCFGSVS